jgi:hypothetical protein
VSTPVKWEEVEQVLKKKDPNRLVFEGPQVLGRVEKMGDLFEPVLKLKQKLPKLAADVGAGVLARASSEDGEAATGRRTSATVKDGLEISAQAESRSRRRSKTVKPGKQKAGKKKIGKI